jgi:hypothetical protein
MKPSLFYGKKHTTNYVPPESSDDCFDSDDSVGDNSYVPENYKGE